MKISKEKNVKVTSIYKTKMPCSKEASYRILLNDKYEVCWPGSDIGYFLCGERNFHTESHVDISSNEVMEIIINQLCEILNEKSNA